MQDTTYSRNGYTVTRRESRVTKRRRAGRKDTGLDYRVVVRWVVRDETGGYVRTAWTRREAYRLIDRLTK